MTGEGDDLVLKFGNRSIRIPGGKGAVTYPRVVDVAFAFVRDGSGLIMGLLTDEPTVEAIASGGQELVLTNAFRIGTEDFLKFADSVNEAADVLESGLG